MLPQGTQCVTIYKSGTIGWHFYIALFLVMIPLGNAGCQMSLPKIGAGGWLMDFDAAESRVAETGEPLLILYRDARHTADDDVVGDALKSQPLAAATSGYVRCMLFRPHEPDRRYVAQYGVDRAPALIVVHGDGTYHARSGAMSSEEIAAFLDQSQPPGARPTSNPHIVRQTHYRWHDTIDEAEAVATQADQPMLVVFHRRFSRDWERMTALLAPHEVYSRLAELVPAKVALHGLFTEAYITRFGALKLPAMAIAHPDGRYFVLELPASSEAVVRFADAAMRDVPVDAGHTASAAPAASQTP